jgi:hypothetical protein
MPGPRYVVSGEVAFESIGLEGASVINAVVFVDRGDQLILNACPIPPKTPKHVQVDGYAVVFHRRRSGHIAPAQQGPGEVDPCLHCRQQPLECCYVLFAIIQDRSLFIPVSPASICNSLLEPLLFSGSDAVETVVCQRPQQAGAGRRVQPVGEVAELGEEVKNPFGHGPTEHAVATQFGAGVIRDKQNIGTSRMGRDCAHFIEPDPKPLLAAQFLGDHANGHRPFTLARFKLEIYQDDFAVRTQHSARPRSRLMTGLSRLVIRRSRNARRIRSW